MPLDLPSSPRRPLVHAAIPVSIVTEDAQVDSALRARLSAAHELWLTPDANNAQVILWDPAQSSDEELPTLPLEPSSTGADTAVIALVDEDTDPMPLLAAGVRGLIHRDAGADRLRATVIAAALGLTILDEDPADGVVAAWSPAAAPRPAPNHDRLTPREHEVLEHLADGLSNRKIGEALGISAHTVKFHVDALLDKLSARSRTQVVVKAMREGLLALV